MKANAGEVYTVYNQYLKRYTACQVAYIAPPDTVSKESWAVVLSLDWVGDAPLTAEELPHLRPLYKDFMYWSRDLHLLRVPLEVPGPVHEVLVERAETGQFLRCQRGVTCPVQREDHCPGLPAHRARRRDIGHLAGGVAFQVSIVDCIDLSGLCFHTCASP